MTVLLPVIGGWALYNQDINSTKTLIRSNIANQLDNLTLLIYPAIAFDDKESAFDVLKSFSTNPLIISSSIWKKEETKELNFTLFANYPEGQLNRPVPQNFLIENYDNDEIIFISKVITAVDEKLGVISVTRSLEDLNSKKAEYLQVGILTALSIFIIIILITLWYQSSLTKPLKELSSVAEKISKEKNYSIRATKTSLDEFGSLTDVFNEMLDSLQISNSQLRTANEEMEQRVEQRTKQLTLSNKRITKEMSEKELATQELIKTRDQLNQSEKLANVGQVSSNIAHELRNPLAAIRNSTYLLRLKLKENDKLMDHLKIIDHEISRSDEVIERLLEITKGENLKRVPVNVEALAKEAMDYADVTKEHELVVTFMSKPFWVKLDKLLFRQILINIFLNSIQAMSKGGEIEMKISQDLSKSVKITIKDEGIGIKQNLLKTVFEPLFTDKPEGVGLGLSLCKDLISRHGGTIIAKSELGLGTTIEIELPVE
ncbi:MAG: ATP-binding protein [Opitutales bacterium]|nr:ATP-binding protein [Opitutales bacterium]